MNGLTKGFIGLAIFGAGFGAGYLFTRSSLERKYAAIADEEIESVKAALGKNRIVIKDTEEDYIPGETKEDEPREYNSTKDFTGEISDYDPFKDMTEEEIEEARQHHRRVVGKVADGYINYSGYYQKPPLNEVAARNGVLVQQEPEDEDEEEIEEEDIEQEIADGESLGEVNDGDPYIIDPEDYDNECEHYDKIELYYYAKDDTLCDEDDTPIDDIYNVCGNQAIAMLNQYPNVYVRNERIGADYAIHKLNRSFREEVLGIAETPSEREYRHLARRKAIMDGDGDDE